MIMYCVDYDNNGAILQTRAGPTLTAIPGYFMKLVPTPLPYGDDYYIDNDVLIKKPIPPNSYYRWDPVEKRWYSDETVLSAAIASKKNEVDLARVVANEQPIMYLGHLFDGDSVSQSNVMAWMVNISNGVNVPEGFTWRDFYNVDHPANAEFIVGLGNAMVTRGSLLYQQSWEFKTSIDQLTSISAINEFTFEFNSQ